VLSLYIVPPYHLAKKGIFVVSFQAQRQKVNTALSAASLSKIKIIFTEKPRFNDGVLKEQEEQSGSSDEGIA
jgi:hypothetical protein